jgi:hypothetical protein
VKNVFVILVALVASGSAAAHAQWKQQPSTGSPEYRLEDRTIMAGQSGLSPTLTAQLVAPQGNATQHEIVVQTQIDGVQLQYPQNAGEANLDRAHIEYQLDDLAPEESARRTWTFTRVSPGDHTVTVRLVSGDNEELVHPTRLRVHVP